MSEPAPDWNEIAATPEPLAAIEAGDLPTALSGFAVRHLLDYRIHMRLYADDDICGFGLVLWLMGDRLGAATVWSKVCDEAFKGRFAYSSSGAFRSGLLLWFASVWLKDEDWHDESSALLDKLLRKKRPPMGMGFYALLARLLRGEIDFEQIQSHFSDDYPPARDEEERQALFYAGVRAYETGNIKLTREFWNQAKAPKDSQVELEYYLLVHERKKLGV